MPAESGALFAVTSPHTEKVIARVAAAGPEDIDRAVGAARTAFDSGPWPKMTPAERAAVLIRFVELYKQHRGGMASLISAEMGAPITFATRAHVRIPMMMTSAFCTIAARYPFAELRPGLYGNDIEVRREPVGVVAAIVPWNMPQFLITAKVVPALLAGCTVVLKSAPETPMDALLFAELMQEAGLPAGVLNVVSGGAEAGDALVRNGNVDKVTFTGSTAVGRRIAEACGRDLRPVSLELGGKSAAIVLDDADPVAVASAIVTASLANSGQVCNALTRILVPARRSAEFVDALVAAINSLRIGDPADPATDIGPLVTRKQQERVAGYIGLGRREGARIVTGGATPPKGLARGWYVQPTLFTKATNAMRIAREEIFGPVLTVIDYRDEEEAIAIANDSDYGLAGSVFTGDLDRAAVVASDVRTGTFGINHGYVMDPLAPFGGVKCSGYGRELGREGIVAYTTTKSISRA
ncbi:aldehyde dehydrogenase [Rhodococcus sp. SJ-3]|uniref:aldehyde dehydrogenase n=1 Tax=Rhodococcus sp. SJ-3 TaxID=3454628 RepID=UPI003F7A7A1C